VLFKDGFIVRGVIKLPETFVIDPATGASFRVGKLGAFYHIDDGVRNINFARTSLHNLVDDDSAAKLTPLNLFHRPYSMQLPSLPNGWSIEEVTPFDDQWQRKIKLDTSQGIKWETQRLVLLTPRAAVVQAKDYKWTYYYHTRELGPEVARGLVYKHMNR